MLKVNRAIVVEKLWWLGLLSGAVVFDLKLINAFELPKLIWLAGWSGVGAVIALFEIKNIWKKTDKIMMIAGLGWWLGLVWFGMNKEMARCWWGEASRWQGLWLFGMIGVICIVSIGFNSPKAREWINKVWVAIMAITGLIGWGQYALKMSGRYYWGYADRMGSSFGQANNWADWAVVGMAVVLFDKRSSRKLKNWAIGWAGMVVWLASSRWAGGVWLILVTVYGLRKVGGWAIAIWPDWEPRIKIWQKAGAVIREMRGRGLGPSGVGMSLGTIDGLGTNQAHNFLMDTIIMGGAISGAGLVVMLARAGWIFVKKADRGGLAGLMSWIVLNCVHSQGVMNWVTLAMMLGWTGNERRWKKNIFGWQIGIGLAYGVVIAGIVAKRLG